MSIDKELNIISAKMTAAALQRQVQAIRTCFLNGYTENTAEALALVLKSLENIEKELSEVVA